MPDIFLSYTREDQATAQRFAGAFEAQGFSVWWDATLRSGEAYDQVTEEALRTAKAVVVLWSKKSVMSRWVRAEATLADRNRTLVPATIELCERPIMFELTHTADLSHWSGAESDPAWRSFLADVRRCVEVRTESKSAPVLARETPPMPAHTRNPSLAILPFINRSGHAEDDAFADGMVEDLTAELSANHWITVVAASATATYRKGARDLRQIGRDLTARYLLEGNVRRVGEQLRVTAQLVDADSGSILSSQKFVRTLMQLQTSQDDLVAEVSAHLRLHLERAERRPVWHFNNPTRSAWEASVAEQRRAIEIDPNDGPAYASLASSQGQLLHYLGDDHELTQEIIDNIRRARALTPNDPFLLGQCAGALIGLGRVEEALPLAEQGVALLPHDAAQHFILGSVFARLRRSDEALVELDAVERLAPDSIWAHRALIWRSVAHLQAGRLDQALEAAERSLRLVLGSDPIIQSTLCLARLDRWDRARDALRRLHKVEPEITGTLVERLVRHIYGGSEAVDDYVATARKVWDSMAGEPERP
jgi:TolB-like protein